MEIEMRFIIGDVDYPPVPQYTGAENQLAWEQFFSTYPKYGSSVSEGFNEDGDVEIKVSAVLGDSRQWKIDQFIKRLKVFLDSEIEIIQHGKQ